MKCRHPGCGAEITWAIHIRTLSRMPLVPYDSEAGDTKRYSTTLRSDGVTECSADPEGMWMSHYANCPGAASFSHRNKRKAVR